MILVFDKSKPEAKDSLNRLLADEAEKAALVLFKLHNHLATTPAEPIWWERLNSVEETFAS